MLILLDSQEEHQIQQVKRSNTKAYETTCGWLMSCLPVIGFIVFGLIPMVRLGIH